MKTKFLSAAIVATMAAAFGAHAAPPAHSAAATRAKGLLDANPAAAHRNASDAFVVQDVMVDANGTEHVRMERQYRGLPVFGGDVVVHSRNGKLASVSHSVRSSIRPQLNERVDAAAAVEAAGAAFGPDYERVPTLRKVLYARHMAPILAWEVRLQGDEADGSMLDKTYFVDAQTGKLLLGVSNVHSAKGGPSGGTTAPVPTTPGIAAVGTGNSLLNGKVLLNTTTSSNGYVLTDSTRGNLVTRNANNATVADVAALATVFNDADNAWGNATKRDGATVAADAHYGAATTWDFYQQMFGRLGIRGDGAGTTTYVHVGTNMANAYWYNGAMYYGDGNSQRLPYVSLDIAGHEMTHGVTQATAGLVYSGESGGLNEATSDIMGTMVEHFANNASDVPDYTLAEKIMKSGAVRYMYKPSLDGRSPDCYSSAVMSMDPHQASGIGNHFFYLLAQGAVAPAGTSVTSAQLVCNGNTALRGIGRDAAQRIWYQALTRYMTSNTNYAGAREATLQAAADLGYPAGSTTYNAVAAAWSAINVN